MILVFTDFGLEGPYTGQMKAVLHQLAPAAPAIDLFADAPVGNPKASAYLLASYAQWFPAGTVFLCVVDPGVGGTRQLPVTFSGYYVMATTFLTGERREGYSRGVNPVRNFDMRSPIANPGAWELAARVSYLHVSDNIFRTGALNNLAAAAGNAVTAAPIAKPAPKPPRPP